ncbi:hypothetical protein [Streptomyces sp. NPDC050121]|uniref:hypothetical protein n=1 Tax=Streptomyces sp. NPDC050121 TaxID=3365601 RepID=UPI0037B06AF5
MRATWSISATLLGAARALRSPAVTAWQCRERSSSGTASTRACRRATRTATVSAKAQTPARAAQTSSTRSRTADAGEKAHTTPITRSACETGTATTRSPPDRPRTTSAAADRDPRHDHGCRAVAPSASAGPLGGAARPRLTQAAATSAHPSSLTRITTLRGHGYRLEL